MKKLLPITIILALLLIEIVGAVTVSVNCVPQVIPPGGTTTITVTCDQNGSGSITVITPGGSSSAVSITVTAGQPIYKVYPTDFPPPANTTEVGEYEVSVFLSGDKYKAYFWVSFTVIPQTPLGVFGAIAACFAAFGAKQFRYKKNK